MKRLYLIFIITVICAPVIFLVYLKNDLVCAPRAILSSAIFGVAPLLFLTVAVFRNIKTCYYLALVILVIEMIITPIIMIERLGWEKFFNERLLAFFTFEGIAIIQFLIAISMMKYSIRLYEDSTK